MRDISARELKGHNILAVERFQDNTRWMIEFSVQRPSFYGSPGDEMRLFLSEDGYQAALLSQQRREIKIKRYARVIEGHILDFKPDKRRRHPYLAFASSTEKAKMPFVLQSMNWNALGIFDADKLQMPPGSSGPTNTASMSAPLQIVRRWGVRHRKNRQRKSR